MKRYFIAIAVAAMALFVSCSKQEKTDPTALSLDKTELTLMVGDTYTLTVNNNTDKLAVAFKSDDPSIATVSSKSGKVTGKKEGNTVIKAVIGNTTLECKVTVTPKENVVSSVSIGSDFSLKEGETKQLTADIQPTTAEDYEEASKTLKWASDDESVAKVSEAGLVTAQTVPEGETKTATISATVTSRGREVKGTVKVTVSSSTILVSGLILNETEITLNEGGTRQLTASIDPANATDAQNALKTLAWKSDDESIASVSASGLVTAKSVPEGETKQTKVTATVTSKGKEYSASATVIVSSNVIKTSSIQLSQSDLKLNPGEEATLTYTLYPENHTDSPVIEWSTSDASIATVEGGKVTAVDYGSAIVSASIKGTELSASCSVLVREGPKTGTTIDMSATYFLYTWPESLSSLEEVTLEAWVNIGNASSEQSFLGTEGVFLIRAQSGSYQAVTGGGSASGWTQATETVISSAGEVGEWHHVAATYSSNKTFTLYVDGAKVSEDVSKLEGALPMNGVEGYVDGSSNPNVFMVGNSYGRNRFLQGNIAYARVWKVARTQEQIAANMAKKTPAGDGLIASWYFTEASGNTIKDYSSTGADLTPVSGDINWVSGTLPAVE